MGFTAGRAKVRPLPYRYEPPVTPAPVPPVSYSPVSYSDDAPGSGSAREDFAGREAFGEEEAFLDIEPLLDRLERVESRVEALGSSPRRAADDAPAPANYARARAELESRLDDNARDLSQLRDRVEAAERRAAESLAAVQKSVAETRAELPVLMERHVSARFDDLHARFAAEIEQSHQRTLETFERAIDERISARIGVIEKSLADQAGSIEALRQRAGETDNNLQRLVSAIEKLCERAQLIAPAPDPVPAPRGPMPRPGASDAYAAFDSQLHEAMRRETTKPVVVKTERPDPNKVEDQVTLSGEVQVAPPAFAAATGAPAAKKSRFFFRNSLVAGFAFLASRFLR
jgi:uncharacterized coiled-coil protein SlyX